MSPATAGAVRPPKKRRPTTHILFELRQVGLDSMLEALAKARHVRVDDIVKPRRDKSATAARHAWWLFLYEECHRSYKEIERIHGFDHSTIANGIQKARDERGAAAIRESRGVR